MKNVTERIEKLVAARRAILISLAIPENFRALRKNQADLAEVTGFDFEAIPVIYGENGINQF